MNSRLRAMFVIFVALVLFLPSGEGMPVGREERTEFPEGENPSRLSESIDKRLSNSVVRTRSRPKKSDVDSVTDDGKRDNDVDYDLMGKLLDEYMLEHGGNLDRELEDKEYDLIVENYEKYIKEREEEEKKKKDKAINGTLTTPDSGVHTTKRISDDGKSISPTPALSLSSSNSSKKQESYGNISTTHIRDSEHSTPSRAIIKTSTESPFKLSAMKSSTGDAVAAKDRWWVKPTTTGTPVDGSGSLSWTGDSKGGHRVHVVVYFD